MWKSDEDYIITIMKTTMVCSFFLQFKINDKAPSDFLGLPLTFSLYLMAVFGFLVLLPSLPCYPKFQNYTILLLSFEAFNGSMYSTNMVFSAFSLKNLVT